MAEAAAARCARCGAAMTCDPDGDCWCKSVPARLPVTGDSCLCPTCLAAAIDAHQEKGRSEERP